MEKDHSFFYAMFLHSMKNMTNEIAKHHNKMHWEAAAAGLLLILIALSRNMATGSPMYRIKGGLVYPALFMIAGYVSKQVHSIRKFGKRTLYDFLLLCVTSFAAGLLLQIYTFCVRNWGNTNFLLYYLRKYGYSVLYCSPGDLGDIQSIGPVWMLIALFYARAIANITCLAADYIDVKTEKVDHNTVMLILGIAAGLVGLILSDHHVILFFGVNTGLVAAMFFSIGRYWRKVENIIQEKTKGLLAAICGLIGILALYFNAVADMCGYQYRRGLLSILLTLCCIYSTCWVVKNIICKVRGMSDFLTAISHHSILLMLVCELEAVYAVMWTSDYVVLSSIIRTILDLAVCELVLQVQRVFYPSAKHSRIEKSYALKYHSFFQILFYPALAFAYVAIILTQASIDKLIASELQNVLMYLSAAILLYIFAMRVPNISKRWIPGMMSILIGLAICQAIIRNEFSLELMMFIMIAAAIGADSHLIGKITWVVGLIFMIVVYRLSMSGIIPYNIAGSGASDLTGHAFGFLEKNTTAAFLLGNMLAYCLSRKSNNRIYILIDVIVMGTGIFINQRYIGGRSDLALMVLLLAGTVIYRLVGTEPLRNRSTQKINRVFHYISYTPIYLFIFVVYLSISWNYDGEHAPFQSLIGKVTDPTTYAARLWLSKTALLVYQPKLWGQYIFENSTTDTSLGAGYFWIDSSYARILLMDGIVLTAAFLLLSTLMIYLNIKKNRVYYAFLGAVVALMGIMGHRMFSPVYNVIILSAFAMDGLTDLGSKSKTKISDTAYRNYGKTAA